MDRLEAMRAFVAVAEAGGFAAAARRLSLSPPAVTRAVAALEARIGAVLLRRTTRVVRLTDAGAHYLADCKRLLAAIEDAEATAAGAHGALRGALGVTAPAMFGRLFVAPIVLDFLARHPGVAARALLVDRVVDLVDEGLDVAVRIARLPDSSLRAARVGAVRVVVCASPAYLAARGRPRAPAELARHDRVALAPLGRAEAWAFGRGSGRVAVAPPTPLVVNTAEAAVAAALAGRGLARLLSYQVDAELRAGRLAIVLAEFEPKPVPVHVVSAEGRAANARARAFIDLAVERLRAEPALR